MTAGNPPGPLGEGVAPAPEAPIAGLEGTAIPSPAPEPSAWRTMAEGLPENIRSNPEFQKHGNLESLAQEYVNIIPTIGRKGVILPQEGNQADSDRFWAELGRPASPADYDIQSFQVPEGLPWDEGQAMEMIALCHSANVTNEQIKVLLPGYAKIQNEMFQAIGYDSQQHLAKTQQVMQEELGATYQSSINVASRTMQHLFGEDAEGLLTARLADGTMVGNHPVFIRGMIKAGMSVGEDNLPTDAAASRGGSHAMTPEAANQEIQKLMADPKFNEAYLTAGHVDHAASQARMDELYAYRGTHGATVDVGGETFTGRTKV